MIQNFDLFFNKVCLFCALTKMNQIECIYIYIFELPKNGEKPNEIKRFI